VSHPEQPVAPALKPGDRLGEGGEYEILERIGDGDDTTVVRARSEKLGEVALKVLRGPVTDVRGQRFRMEAVSVARLSQPATHPHVVQIHEFYDPRWP
jgi:hypothetical protein